MRTFKTSVRKNIDDNLSTKDAVHKFLSTYRFMPNAEGKSPAEIMRGRPVRTVWSQLLESSSQIHQDSPNRQKYQINDTVFVRNYAKGKKWIPGIITAKIGKVIFSIKTEKGFYRRHINQMKPHSTPVIHPNYFEINDDNQQDQNSSDPSISLPSSTTQQLTSTETEPASTYRQEDFNTQQQVRRTSRIRREVSRYQPNDFRKNK